MKPDKADVIAFVNEHYEYRDGVFYWKKMTAGSKSNLVGKVAGVDDITHGRWRQFILGHLIQRSMLVWLMHNGDWPAKMLFRADGDNYNDRIENLTLVRPPRVLRKEHRALSSKRLEGITHMPNRGLWRVQVNDRTIGMYPDLSTAVAARDSALSA